MRDIANLDPRLIGYGPVGMFADTEPTPLLTPDLPLYIEPGTEEPGPPWWLDPANVPLGYHQRPDGSWIEAPNPRDWRSVRPHPTEPGQWHPGEWQAYEPELWFQDWLRDIPACYETPPLYERVRPDDEERWIREQSQGNPTVEARLRRLHDKPALPRMLGGDILEIGHIWCDRMISRLGLPSPDECLDQHIRGQWGLNGKATDPTIGPLTRKCPGVASEAQKNLLALERCAGVVSSAYLFIQRPGRGPYRYIVKTLLVPGGTNISGVQFVSG